MLTGGAYTGKHFKVSIPAFTAREWLLNFLLAQIVNIRKNFQKKHQHMTALRIRNHPLQILPISEQTPWQLTFSSERDECSYHWHLTTFFHAVGQFISGTDLWQINKMHINIYCKAEGNTNTLFALFTIGHTCSHGCCWSFDNSQGKILDNICQMVYGIWDNSNFYLGCSATAGYHSCINVTVKSWWQLC